MQTQPSLIQPRRPLLAASMSLALPGFGQLYNGQLNRAIWLFLIVALLLGPVLMAIALGLAGRWMMGALLAGLLATLGTWLFAIVDAWRGARRRTDFVARPWQTSGLYALVLALCGLVAIPALTGWMRARQVESFRVPSTSMEPGIMHGDLLFADKRYNCPGCKGAVQRGDIAIFSYPNDRTVYYIKRIVALPGDHVELRGHELFVNGVTTLQPAPAGAGQRDTAVTEGIGERRWQVTWGSSAPPGGDGGRSIDLTVPPGHVWVLGDRRESSVDSRQFGPVALPDVVGRAHQVWFSYADGQVRWSRLGQLLQ